MKKTTKYLFVIYCLLLNIYKANAQINLVPNPSFEDTLSCVITPPQFYAKIWDQYQSCDYYNNIMHPHCFGSQTIPSNSIGFQYPRTGNAYSGFATFANNASNYREWLQIKLSDSLIAGKTYCINFYYSCAENSKYATDKLGAYVSANGVNLTALSFIQYNPQIFTPNGTTLNNMTSWNQVSGSFTATGGEKYITLGNFFDDLTTNKSTLSPPVASAYSYYYIDDVSILLTDVAAFAGNDTTMCGDSTYIGRPSEVGLNDDCIWYVLGNATPIDTIAGLWVKPGSTTSYVLEQNICGTITYDTVTVTVKPNLSLLNFNGTYNTCTNDSVKIGQPALPNVNYTWSPSSGLNNTTIAQPNALPPANQIYSVTAVTTSTAYCSGIGTGTVSVNVKPPFVMSALTNTFICSGDRIQIGNVPVTDINYQWQPLLNITNPNSSQTFVYPNINTTYSLIATPNTNSTYCTKADTITEQIIVKPQLRGNVTATANPQRICPNQYTQLLAIVTNSVGLQWNWLPANTVSNPTISNPITSPTADASYTLITTATGTSHYCGADTSKTTVRIIKPQPNANAGMDTIICAYQALSGYYQIGSLANPCPGCIYNWQPPFDLQNTNTPATEVNIHFLYNVKNYQYVLTKTDSCQSTTDTVNILVKDCRSDSILISVPNVFTPNNDNKNDTWSMNVVNGLEIFDIQTTVYNRWGKKVFESTNINQNWNGHNFYDGDLCSEGTYFYVISYTDGNTNKTKTLQGFLELIR